MLVDFEEKMVTEHFWAWSVARLSRIRSVFRFTVIEYELE
jgi:hypothetical protein